MSRRAAVFTTLGLAVLAGCAGGGSGTLPGAPGSPDTHAVAPRAVVVSPSPTPSPTIGPVNGTLYVAQTSSVYAYPLGAAGTTSASRTISPHPQHPRIIQAIATNADGTLDVLANYFLNNQSQCGVNVEPADANGSPTGPNFDCDPTHATLTQGDGVARNSVGGFDILYNTNNNFILKRYANDGSSGTPANSITFSNFAPLYLASPPGGGHDYLASNQGEIRKYPEAATTSAGFNADCTISAANGDGPIAVAPDKTIYIVVKTQGSLTGEEIQAITGCTTGTATVSRTIGPFSNNYVSALAVDSQGELYVGMNSLAQTNVPPSFVRVYPPGANGTTPTVQRRIDPTPSTNYIRGLAIYE